MFPFLEIAHSEAWRQVIHLGGEGQADQAGKRVALAQCRQGGTGSRGVGVAQTVSREKPKRQAEASSPTALKTGLMFRKYVLA